jgi:RimJ/RimL family protein N-acetyltransferase
MIPVPPEIVGPGVRLRPLDASDAALIATASRTDIPDWTFIPRDLDDTAARDWIERGMAARRAGRGIRFAIEIGRQSVGTIGAQHPYAHDDGIVETFYFVLPEHRGHGTATTALRLLNDWLRDTVDSLRRLQLHVIPDNPGSGAVATRAGYRREGVVAHQIPEVNGHPVRDAVLYGVAVTPHPGAHTGGVLA